MFDSNHVLGLLLDIKRREGLEVDDEVIKQCYELQRKYQFELNRDIVIGEMRQLIEQSLNMDEDKQT